MKQKRQKPSSLTSNTTEQLFEYLDSFEEKLLLIIENQEKLGSMIADSQRFSQAVATSEYRRDLTTMANFQELADQVAKIKGTVASTKAFVQGLKTKIEELGAGMNDAEDQAAVVALAAELAGAETELAEAIAANPTGSTGGV